MHRQSTTSRPEDLSRWIGPALFLFALLIYCVTLARGPFPGQSATLVAQHVGLDPFPSLSHPLWGFSIRLLSYLPLLKLSLAANLLSAVCGAGAIWIFYEIHARLPHNRTSLELATPFPRIFVQQLSGLVAALYLMVCIPFWIASTRAYYFTFDILLMLVCINAALRYAENPNMKRLYVTALLCGLAIVEFSSFILITPFLGIYLLLAMWRSGHLKKTPALNALAFFLAGLAVYLVEAWVFQRTEAAEWRNFTGYFQVLWFVWLDQYAALTRTVPRVGWLLIGLQTVIPWLCIVAFPKKIQNRKEYSGVFLLSTLVSIIALVVLFDILISPWRMFGFSTLIVTPHLLIASCAGYLAGFWYIAVTARSRFDAKSVAWFKRLSTAIYLPLIALVLVGGFVMNIRVANGRHANFISWFAYEVVDRLEEGTWLLSAGTMESTFLVAAHDRGKTHQFLNRRRGRSSPYLAYMASLFDTTRLKGLTQVGLTPALNEWIESDPDISDKLVVLDDPDLWLLRGYLPLPQAVYYAAYPQGEPLDTDEVMTRHRAFWSDVLKWRDRITRGNNPMSFFNDTLFQHISKLANNLGVLLEDYERPELAIEAYDTARKIGGQNVSALLNSLSLATRNDLQEKAELEAEYESYVEALLAKENLWARATLDGYVRHPGAFLERGAQWAAYGKPEHALQDIQRAKQLGAEGAALNYSMAVLYFRQGRDTESQLAYDELMEQEGATVPVLLGMARIAMRKGAFGEATAYLDKMDELDAPPGMVELERATMASLAGNTFAAKKILSDLTRELPGNIKAWGALALLAADENDVETVEDVLARLKDEKEEIPAIRMVFAQIAHKKKDYETAREELEEVLRVNPNDVGALQLLVRVEMQSGRRENGEIYLEKLLNLNPRSAFGNFVLGGLQVTRGEYPLAEASFRASVTSHKTPEALRHLAWVLREMGANREALTVVNDSLEMTPGNGDALDTKGIILMNLGRYEEAEQALKSSLLQSKNDVSVLFHLAQLYEKKGDHEKAVEIADGLLARPNAMKPSYYEEVRELVLRIRGET